MDENDVEYWWKVDCKLRIHFPELRSKEVETVEDINNLSCEKCEDFKTSECSGRGLIGEAVFRDCMMDVNNFQVKMVEGK